MQQYDSLIPGPWNEVTWLANQPLLTSLSGIFSFRLLSFCLLSFRLLSRFLSHFAYSFFKMFYVGTLLPLWECMVAMHNHPVDTAEIKAYKIRSRLKTKAQETAQSLRTLTRSLADCN